MTAAFTDIVAEAKRRDTCVVFPTLSHAVYWWPRLSQEMAMGQNGQVKHTKTAITHRSAHTVLRLWVPTTSRSWTKGPEQPMDAPNVRRRFHLMSMYLSQRDLNWYA